MASNALTYLSQCSGIEAATVAWHPLGWQPWAFSEIERFPSAVLTHHYPHVPNLGDMTRFEGWPDATLDLLVGGTPCQSFSVAGMRRGLDDPRGNLMLVYGATARRYRPRWLVWENVPGVLSSNKGRDFGTFLGMLAELGYGFAYRVLDAQYVRVDGYGRAVPQRRRRVFVVGYLGDWRRAAAVLFDAESLRGNPAPRRQSREGIAATLAGGARCRGGISEDDIPHVALCLNAGAMGRIDSESETFIPVAHSLRGEGFDASEDGTGRGIPLVPYAFQSRGTNLDISGNITGTLGCNIDRASGGAPCIAFDSKASGRNGFGIGEISPTLRAMGHSNSHCNAGGQVAVAAPSFGVRRLMPIECERLQGFPDNYTQVPFRGKPAADGPRYKALGNSMAVNVMRWIGRRIDAVESISQNIHTRRDLRAA